MTERLVAEARHAAPALDVTNLTVRYGDVLALDHVNLTLGWGRVCGLIGVNGSGKSTLMKSVIGLVRPEQGEIRLGGLPPEQARSDGLVAYVPQTEAVDFSFPLSVHDVVMMGRFGHLGFTRRPSRADRSAVADALEQVELTPLRDRQIGQLSGGQRKRAFVARGIAQGAKLLLLDEPFAGVDKRSEATIARLLRRLADADASVLIATHDLPALPELADEAVLLQRSILAHGSPRDVLEPAMLARVFGLQRPASNSAGPTALVAPAQPGTRSRPATLGAADGEPATWGPR